MRCGLTIGSSPFLSTKIWLFKAIRISPHFLKSFTKGLHRKIEAQMKRRDIIVFIKKEQVSSHPASNAKVEHESEREGGGRRRGKEKRVLGRGKVQGKKVEKENGECTCNLTVMKGTPRKECNKTKGKWVRLEGVGCKKEREKKKRKILNFHPAAWERSVFLPVSQAPMKWESQADLLSQTLFS